MEKVRWANHHKGLAKTLLELKLRKACVCFFLSILWKYPLISEIYIPSNKKF